MSDVLRLQNVTRLYNEGEGQLEVFSGLNMNLRAGEIVALVGQSGAGKSSLLQAGVLPRIRGTGLASAPGWARWPCLVFTPTRSPLDELALRVAVLAGRTRPRCGEGWTPTRTGSR